MGSVKFVIVIVGEHILFDQDQGWVGQLHQQLQGVQHVVLLSFQLSQ